jgi:hypothetical protein
MNIRQLCFSPIACIEEFGFVALPISAGAGELGPHIANYWN